MLYCLVGLLSCSCCVTCAQGLEQAGNRGEKDVRVLRALRNIFDAFATPLEADAASLADAANADGFLPGACSPNLPCADGRSHAESISTWADTSHLRRPVTLHTTCTLVPTCCAASLRLVPSSMHALQMGRPAPSVQSMTRRLSHRRGRAAEAGGLCPPRSSGQRSAASAKRRYSST